MYGFQWKYITDKFASLVDSSMMILTIPSVDNGMSTKDPYLRTNPSNLRWIDWIALRESWFTGSFSPRRKFLINGSNTNGRRYETSTFFRVWSNRTIISQHFRNDPKIILLIFQLILNLNFFCLPSAPKTPKAATILCVRRKGTVSGTLKNY